MKRIAALVPVVLALLWIGASPAFAHVLLAKAQPNPDGTTTLTFTFDHGCGESPTTGLSVDLPAGVTAKSASGPEGWQAPAESTRAVFTGPAITAGEQAEFLVTVTITGAAVGRALAFPATQTCANGETLAWKGSQATAEHPAPSLIVTAAMIPAPAPATAPSQGASLPAAAIALAILAALAGAAGFVWAPKAAD